MILTTFYYHLLLCNFALNGPPEAADDPYLHLGVALEATLGIRNFWVFLIQLTFPSMGKVVSFLLEFLRILGTTGGCTVSYQFPAAFSSPSLAKEEHFLR